MPFPQILKIIITARAINAKIQFVEALAIALGARLKPIQIMIGPVTTGGKKRMTRLTPANLMISAKTK